MSVFDWFKRRPDESAASGSCCSGNPADAATLVEDRPATTDGATDPAAHTESEPEGAQDMGLIDNLKQKLSGHSDKVEQGVDKAGQVADEKTGGKHTDQIRTAGDKAKEKLTDSDDRPKPPADPNA